MVKPHRKSMDPFYYKAWPQMELYRGIASRYLSAHQNTVFPRQKETAHAIHFRTIAEKSYHGSSFAPKRQGILFPSLSGSKEIRGPSARPGPQAAQQKDSNRGLQDGESPVHPPGSKSRGLDAVDRPVRRLPPCANTSRIPEVPALFHRPTSLPIPMSTIRDLFGSQDVHKG